MKQYVNNSIIIILFVLGIIYMIINSINSDSNIKKYYKFFDKASIYGRIIEIQKGKVSINFKINTRPPTRYMIVPDNTGPASSATTTLSYLIEIGDSISKNSEADTIFLFKKDGVYKFSFKK